MLERLKTFLRDDLGLTAFPILLLAGGALHVALNAVLRRPPTSALGLLGPLLFGVALEAYEIFVQYKDVGLLAPGNDPLLVILGRHFIDVLTLLALPSLLVASGFIMSR